MTWVKQLVDMGAYAKSFATLKLGESHYYFHASLGALMFPIALHLDVSSARLFDKATTRAIV